MKYIDVERVRKESANVLVVEDANPGSPHLSSVYVDDLCVEIERLRERCAKAEAERDAERTVRIAKTEEVNRYKAHYEKVVDALTLAEAELAAAVAHVTYWRESITEALNRSPEHWYDKHDNGRSALEHAVHAIDSLFAERDAERALASRYLAAIVEHVEAEDAWEQAEESYTSFGSRMMDRSLTPVGEAEVTAAFTSVAAACDRAYAATAVMRAIVEEARRKKEVPRG